MVWTTIAMESPTKRMKEVCVYGDGVAVKGLADPRCSIVGIGPLVARPTIKA